MKIAMFSDSYHPYTSGVVRSVETFTHELTEMGHEVFIFAPNYPNCEQEKGVYRFFSIPSPTNKEFTLAVPFSLSLWTKIKQLQLDVIHVHSPFLLGRLGARWAHRLDIPLVFTYHTLYDKYVHYVPLGQNITKGITQRVTIDFCNQCHKVVVPTAVIADYLKENGVNVPTEVVPTGIDIDEFRRADKQWLRNKYNIPADYKVLLFVGRLGLEKNINFILKSYQEVVQYYPQTVLVIVGSGPEEENLKTIVNQSGLNNKVIFTGKLSKEDTVKCYAGSNIFVFASVTETQGLVLAEAKAAGLPVVAVDAFGVSEMVTNGKDGYLCPLDVNIFTNSLKSILSNGPLCQVMAEHALKNAEQLSAKQCAKRLERVYYKLLPDYQLQSKLHG
ncbi:glycosyltransferase family 4 protein [Peptococcaceae bacterium 1198_IL3148]